MKKNNQLIPPRVDSVQSFTRDNWLTLDRFKEHLAVEDDDLDGLLEDFLNSAVAQTEKIIGCPLADHTRYYLFKASGYDCLYFFNGVQVDENNIEVRSHENRSGYYDFDNQTLVAHNFNDNPGRVKSVFIEEGRIEDDFITVKVPIVWNVSEVPMLKTAILSLASEMYRKRELTNGRQGGINKVLLNQLKAYRMI